MLIDGFELGEKNIKCENEVLSASMPFFNKHRLALNSSFLKLHSMMLGQPYKPYLDISNVFVFLHYLNTRLFLEPLGNLGQWMLFDFIIFLAGRGLKVKGDVVV